MQKLIDGKLYDTDNAELVAGWSNIKDRSDFNYCREELYRTENGRFFIYGQGGARSKYSETTSSGHTGGKDIRAVSEDQAFEWLQAKDQVEEALDLFGDRIEDA
jgi:hypothetical protein